MEKKILFLFAFLFLISTHHSYGQNVEKAVQSKWIDLNSILKKRADNLLEFSNELIKLDTSKEVLFIESKFIASELSDYLSTLQQIDAKTIKIVSIKNNNLTKVLEKIMRLMLDGKTDMKILPMYYMLMPQISGIEKRLELATENYNKTCKKNKRKNLLFINPLPDKKSNL